MSKVAMPSMRRYGYADSLATGVIAAGGTLGILIPPSVILVIYGIMAQQDIGKLFAAGIIPGILGVLGYMAAVRVVTAIKPELGRPAERLPYAERFRALKGLWGVIGLFALVIGGIYLGVFTATEAAGVGAAGAFFFALFQMLSGISAAAGQGEGVGAMSAEQVVQFDQSTIFGAPLSASLLHGGGGSPVSVWVLCIAMILAMTASQLITQRQIMARNVSDEAVATPLMAQQKVLLYSLPVVFGVGGIVFPIGVLIYWTTTNLWTMGQQFALRWDRMGP